MELVAAAADLLIEQDLTPRRFLILKTLRAAGDPGVAPGVLKRELHISGSAVTSLVNGLERQGLVVRTLNVVDRRSLVVCITEQGREILDAVERSLVPAS